MSRRCLAFVLIGFSAGVLLSTAGAARAENACPQQPVVAESETGGDDSGMGGTGFSGDDSGMGGTGFSGDDSGIGGTGFSDDDSGIGGTGIYGTITNSGNLCVNGLRVHYGEDAGIEINGRSAAVERLAVGQVVWVEASAEGGALFAEKISVFSAAIGSVEALDPQGRHLTVNGEFVEVPEGAIVVDSSGREGVDLSSLAAGDIVDVSGLRLADGHIVASRIERTAAAEAADLGGFELSDLLREAQRLGSFSIEGYVADREGPGRFRLDGVEIDTSSLSDRGGIEVDARVWLTGTRVGEAKLRAHRLTVHEVRPMERPNSAERENSRTAAGASDRDVTEVSSEKPDSPEAAGSFEPPEVADLPDPSGRPDVERVATPVRPERVQRPERPLDLERPERLKPVLLPELP